MSNAPHGAASSRADSAPQFDQKYQKARRAYEQFKSEVPQVQLPSAKFVHSCESLTRLLHLAQLRHSDGSGAGDASAQVETDLEDLSRELEAAFRTLRHLLARKLPPTLMPLMSGELDELRHAALVACARDRTEDAHRRATELLEEFVANRRDYVLDPIDDDEPGRDEYAEIFRLNLTKGELKFVEAITSRKGAITSNDANFVMKFGPFSKARRPMVYRLNIKLRAIGWRVTDGPVMHLLRTPTGKK